MELLRRLVLMMLAALISVLIIIEGSAQSTVPPESPTPEPPLFPMTSSFNAFQELRGEGILLADLYEYESESDVDRSFEWLCGSIKREVEQQTSLAAKRVSVGRVGEDRCAYATSEGRHYTSAAIRVGSRITVITVSGIEHGPNLIFNICSDFIGDENPGPITLLTIDDMPPGWTFLIDQAAG